ncbi:PHP domain-containing protein [Lentibacillus amyloliquefaciens]|uniref:ATPase AAA-type core domain-containing protein n=1 Tax=Lentibacillus amyloliquefaciens TaxID=1472767 RepID=A0A0U3W3N4_9BACI|nr:hypothetical protein [Lentibacillus amyloliquefaciens]ALX47776.1 hypothetical protein AOX59_03630 [Lentibacillus amyloliquefaciens]
MKIDLHLHTKKCKQGDGSKRNIGTSDFIKKMRENDVGICAITNHNHFDISAYERIINEDPELVVFPGIELDVKYRGEQYHIIVICEPQKRKMFYETFDNEADRDYDAFYLEYNDFIYNIQCFKPEDIIVIPHFLDKDKKRSLNVEAKDKLSNDLKDYLIILEAGKLQTMGVINAHNELSLIGSDVNDWDKYSESEIPDIKFRISSFKMFYELASDTAVFINTYLQDTFKHSIPVEVDKEKLNNDIEIYEDINVIFGEKGSGKTILLKNYLFPYLKNQGLSIFLHEGKGYNDQYNKILDNFKESVVINEKILGAIKRNFDFTINYNEDIPLDFVTRFKKYYNNNSATKKAEKIKKIDSKFSNNNVNTFESISSNLEEKLSKIIDVKQINQHVRKEEQEEKYLLNEQLNNLECDLIDLAVKDCKKMFISKNTNSFLTVLKNSIQKKTGKVSKPNNIGFAGLVSNRLRRTEANNDLKKKLKEVQDEKVHKLGYIPNKGIAYLVTSIEVLQPDESYNERKIFDRDKIKINRKIMEKIHNFDIKDFKEINEYFDSDEKIVLPDGFSNEIIKKNSVVKIEGNDNYLPSEGEKAIITISGLLEDDNYDCYLFDEIERGLGQKYITDYIIPKLREQRDKGKTIIISTHNSNIAINTLPSQTIYCDYKIDSTNIYYSGNLYTNQLIGIEEKDELVWKEKALVHLEGSEEMFGKRRNIYGV